MIVKHPHVVIVGAGIVGASLAYHLTRENAQVTLIDNVTRSADNATGKSFAWINAGHDGPEPYLHLRQQAIDDWHRVEEEFKGQLKVDWSGALTWYKSTAETERIANILSMLGYPVRLVDKHEICLLEPNLKIVPPQAIFAKNDGAIDPILASKLFIKAARERGADMQTGNEVLSLVTNGSRVTGVVTARGNINADVVVLAAGTHITALCQPLHITLPVTVSPAVLMSFHHAHRFVNRIISSPFMEIRTASNTLLLAAEDYIDESTENNPQAIAQRTLNEIKKHWQGAEQLKLINVVAGKRPIPQDGLPVIGQVKNMDGLYISVMHAGVTLAAIAGRLAAAEVVSNQEDYLLSSFRPERFNKLS